VSPRAAAPPAMTEMPWIKWLDLDTAASPDGLLTVTLARPKPEHFNHNQAINAAVTYGVAEVAGAGAAVLGLIDLLDRTYTVVQAATITYLSPASIGLIGVARLDPAIAQEARSAIERNTPQDIDVHVRLTDLDYRLTGHCDITMALRPRRKDTRGHPG
jgi:hypothetical protein